MLAVHLDQPQPLVLAPWDQQQLVLALKANYNNRSELADAQSLVQRKAKAEGLIPSRCIERKVSSVCPVAGTSARHPSSDRYWC